MKAKEFREITQEQYNELRRLEKLGFDNPEMEDFLNRMGYEIHENWSNWKFYSSRKRLNALRAFQMRDDYIWTMQEFLKKHGIGKELLERFILDVTLMINHKVDRRTDFTYEYMFHAKGYTGTASYFFEYVYDPTSISLYTYHVEDVYNALKSGTPVDEVIKKHILVYDQRVYNDPVTVI